MELKKKHAIVQATFILQLCKQCSALCFFFLMPSFNLTVCILQSRISTAAKPFYFCSLLHLFLLLQIILFLVLRYKTSVKHLYRRTQKARRYTQDFYDKL